METQATKREEAPIRIVVVGDHVILRQGISAMLSQKEDFQVVGEAESAKAALSLTIELKPDIVLVDISLEHPKGLDTAKLLLRSPNMCVVLFACSNDEKSLFEAIRIGVHGYLQKTLSIEDLCRALRAVQCGERVLGESQAVTQAVIELHRLAGEQDRLNRGLSTMEIDLIQLASQGWTNREIGNRVHWSEIQVKRKMQDIYRKLQVADRAQAVAQAIRHGLI